MWWFSSTFLTCTSGSPFPWCTNLLHTLICIRYACCRCSLGSLWSLGSHCCCTSLQPSVPAPGLVLQAGALSELWCWCSIDVGAEREALLCSSKRWRTVSVCFSGCLTIWVRRHPCAWSAWRQRAVVVELWYRQMIFPFYCYFPNHYFYFLLRWFAVTILIHSIACL